jgi:hypothetical protein
LVPPVDVERRAELHEGAAIEHGDARGQRHRLVLVVGDVDRRDAELAVEPAQLHAHLRSQAGVEIGQRLVEEQGARLQHERAGQRHALLLAAGELAGAPRLQPLEAHHAQRRRHALAHLRLAHPASTCWNATAPTNGGMTSGSTDRVCTRPRPGKSQRGTSSASGRAMTLPRTTAAAPARNVLRVASRNSARCKKPARWASVGPSGPATATASTRTNG